MRESEEYGWVIGNKLHKELHPAWNSEWVRFFDTAKESGKIASKQQVLNHLEKMRAMPQFASILKQGTQATMSYGEWTNHLARLRYAANKAIAGGAGGAPVPVPIIRKVGNVFKGVGIVVFIYNVANDGVTVAAEDATEDALWPFMDIAREMVNPASDLYEALIDGGRLNRRRQEQSINRILNDRHAPIPGRPR